jgi:hypothetical protein
LIYANSFQIGFIGPNKLPNIEVKDKQPFVLFSNVGFNECSDDFIEQVIASLKTFGVLYVPSYENYQFIAKYSRNQNIQFYVIGY